MSDIQTYCFARCQANAARRISGFPAGHRLSRFHGHTFRFTALREENEEGPIGLFNELADHVRLLDFDYLPDRIDQPTDERLARWIGDQFLRGGQPISVGIRSAPGWTTVVGEHEAPMVCQSFEFDASHWLPGVPEDHQCARLHGHHFQAAISVNADQKAIQAMQVYEQIANAWAPLQEELQGNCLNDLAGLENPTSELLAAWIFDRLGRSLDGVATVSVCETMGSGCEFDGKNFSIWKDQRFESAVPNPLATTPTAVSGRGYLARLFLRSPLEETFGWVQDFGDVRRAFEPFLVKLDHHYLEQFSPGSGDACVELGQWLMEELPATLPLLHRLDLFESRRCGVSLLRSDASPRLGWPMV